MWDHLTGLYFLAGKVPVSRFIYSWPLVVNFHDGKYTVELMKGLTKSRPDIFVVQSGDATPHVTGEDRDSAQMLAAFPMLERFLKENYTSVQKVGRYSFYKKI